MTADGLEPVWQADEITGVVDEALRIVKQLEPPEALEVPVFNAVVQLLTLRRQRVSAAGMALPASLLHGPHGPH